MNGRILLVEDEIALRTLLEAVLQRAGYDVLTAPNGRVAMECLARGAVDLVVTDIVMPEQEGIETILKIRRAQPELPIIAMSGGGQVEPELYLAIALTAGARYLLTKPFSPAKLLAMIEATLRPEINAPCDTGRKLDKHNDSPSVLPVSPERWQSGLSRRS